MQVGAELPGRPEAGRARSALIARAFGWGSSMALVRLACSFISIKVTAVVLGPAGLALVAQLGSFITLLQSMLGQALVTGTVRLSAEHGEDAALRHRVRATALRLAVALVMTATVLLAVLAAPLAGWLLTDAAYAPLIALAGLAVAAAIATDLMHGALGVSKEVGLIGRSTIGATLLGLAVFAPSAWLWGLTGALWASLAVFGGAALVAALVVHTRSKGVNLREFLGPFDRDAAVRLAGFYPMLIVNGALPPLALILVRDTLAGAMGLEAAGYWQAAWRLSEAYQAVIISSVTLFFMPSLGENAREPAAWRRQVLRTLAAATGATALLAAAIFVLREPVVHLVLSARFEPVITLMPLQLAGDVLKVSGWILGMALVGALRTRWFVAIVALAMAGFVAGTRALVPWLGLEGAQWAYIGAGALQTSLGAFALRDRLWPAREISGSGPAP